MYAGRVVEIGSAERLYLEPAHPYSQGLLRSFPPLSGPRRELTGIPGFPPDLRALPPGCPFAPRCAHAMDICRQTYPPQVSLLGPGHAPHLVSCWLFTDQSADTGHASPALRPGQAGATNTAAAETGPAETGPAETGPAERGAGPAETGPAETGPAETGPAETGPAETGPAETGPAETGPAETGPAETGLAETASAETGLAETAPPEAGPADEGPSGTAAASERATRQSGVWDA